MYRIVLSLMVCLSLVLPARSCIPTAFNLEVETTNELGPNTLARIDAVNRTLATGMEVGPETRQVIRELNETIRQGVKGGFDEATLRRVDELLRVVEDGLKIGLDDETLSTLNGLVEMIDRQPGNWEVAATEIIRTLERSGGSMAGRMADEVKGVMNEARLNMQQMTAIAGTEFRCNVDFLGSKAGATLQEFIGHSIVGKLRNILSGQPPTEPIPTPWVCQVIPERVELVQVGERLIFQAGLLTLTGYNYVDANAPRAYIADEAGNPLPGLQLFPYRTSPYQIQLNLQGLDFSAIPPRSRIVFAWPNVPETTGVAILMPLANPIVASFTFTPTGGNAPLTVQFTDTSSGDPSEWWWDFGDGATSNERHPTHTFVEARRYEIQLTVSNPLGSSSVSQILVVGEELQANFTFSPRQGEAPLVVEFTDRSSGNPTAWEWDFGDGERSNEQNPVHIYLHPRPEGYSVTLRVSNATGSATYTAPDRILVLEKLVADFSASPLSGRSPLTVSFQDQSRGSHIVAWEWDFGDGSTSTERNPVHTYTYDSNAEKKPPYDVTLTVTNAAGQKQSLRRNGYITLQVFEWRPGLILPPLFQIPGEITAHVSEYTLNGGGFVDTGWASDQYVCGIIGMTATRGDIRESGAGDILKAYLLPQYSGSFRKNTWWLSSDFRTEGPEERWVVKVLCLDRKGEGSVFVYREYTALEGGKDHLTGVMIEDYKYCGIVGQAALWGDIEERNVQNVIWQAYMDVAGSEWVIKVDFATHRDQPQETWNVNVLCIKGGLYLATEKPPFLMRTYNLIQPLGHTYTTDIKVSDYECGVVGVSAERGDIEEHGTRDVLLAVRTLPVSGQWQIWADFATHNKEEDWRVDVLCVSKNYVKPPSP
ncbi:PKD domain-containing protein [uncultured Thermanaerothrix sp.]|uniref:PKD domain-containing protein n=1 Tax=uncultured Thermanaerothrix sp. TaxID=1195149 RepID=UPI002627EE98|nr:PKD domain-containing protein [uncultured Thermanaerothrix sp.]